MGKETDIQWCDSTVNPTTGCDGCELHVPGKGGPCYAGNYHEGRMAKALPALYSNRFVEVRLAPGRMAQAAGWSDLRGVPRPGKPWLGTMPRMIFISDMSDALSAAVPFDYLKAEIIDNVTSAKGRRHIWMWLTKRPQRMEHFASWLRVKHGIAWPDNLWAGTSVTSRARLKRLDVLATVPAKVRFVSGEPLFEEVDLSPWLTLCDGRLLTTDGVYDEARHGRSLAEGAFAHPEAWAFHLVIAGGASRQAGHETAPFDLRWARSLRDQCRESGTAFFLKQIGDAPTGPCAACGHELADHGSRLPSPCHHGRTDCDAWCPSQPGYGCSCIGYVKPEEVLKIRDHHGGDWGEWPDDLKVREIPFGLGVTVA